jgi:Reverse transcriptase (RNA-dependent DNA polymerase)
LFVIELLKALYELKQTPLLWNKHLKAILPMAGFEQCNVDSCRYRKIQKNEAGDTITVLIGVYVDDLLIATTNSFEIEKVGRFLQSKFEISNLGEPKFLLGMQIEIDNDKIKLFQST